jgi:hypothetical protein
MRERIGALGDRLAAAAWVAPSAAVALFGLLLARLDVVTDPAVQARFAAALVAHLDRPAIVKRWRELYSTHLAASALVLERLRATPTAVAVRVPHPPRNHGLPLASRTNRERERERLSPSCRTRWPSLPRPTRAWSVAAVRVAVTARAPRRLQCPRHSWRQ